MIQIFLTPYEKDGDGEIDVKEPIAQHVILAYTEADAKARMAQAIDRMNDASHQ